MSEKLPRDVDAQHKVSRPSMLSYFVQGSRPSMLSYVIMGGALIAFVFFFIPN